MNNTLLCQPVLDLLANSQKCINTINNFFRSSKYELESPISVVELLEYTEYGRGTLSTHLQSNEEFYKLLGLSRGVSKQYIINGAVALLVIAKYNDAFAAHIGYTSHADVQIQYLNQLEVQKNKEQLEKVMERTNTFDLSEELAKLEIKMLEELHYIELLEHDLDTNLGMLDAEIAQLQSKRESTATEVEVVQIRINQLNKKLNAINLLRGN